VKLRGMPGFRFRPAAYVGLPDRVRVGRDLAMEAGRNWLFLIHLLTASGAALALLAVVAVVEGNWNLAFVWLGLALLVDGVDGPLARRNRLRERLPRWDGATLDNVIDYTTYVFVPAVIVARAFGLPDLIGTILGIIVAVSGGLYYGAEGMKQPDNSFRGFPVVWNMAIFVAYVFLPPPPVTIVVVLALTVLTFLPVNFVHPVRVLRWRNLTLLMLFLWLTSSAWILLSGFEEPLVVRLVLLVATLYLLSVSGIHQYLRSRERF
jgi:phosphatidylcholine synthase